MNKNPKSKVLPPSPRSSHARKPLINITNMYNNSSDMGSRPSLTKPNSTKNLKPKISIDESNRPKIKEVHSRKNSRSGSVASVSSSVPKEKVFKCKNHPNRTATHRLENSEKEYLCFECSLFSARMGQKIKPIVNNTQILQKELDTTSMEREKEANQYLEKCQHTYGDMLKWRQEQTQVVKEIYEEFGGLINKEQTLMEEEINKIKDLYGNHIKMLEKRREEKIQVFQEADQEIQKLVKSLSETRMDIQSNYKQCMEEFSSTEFRQIMDEYWKILQAAQFFVVSHSVLKLGKSSKDSGIELTLTVRSNANKEKKEQQFTFSKGSRFQTPPLQKSFKGIKYVDSYGQSGDGIPSDLRESIVDSQFCFNDVNPFVA